MKKLILLLFVLCAGITVSAQTTITGTVTSQTDGSTLAGVSVSIKGTALGTTTDGDGNFSLTIPSNRAVFTFKYLGFKEQQVPVSDVRSNVKVAMEENIQLLDEVVVVSIGYGTARKSDLTGAISSIGAKEIANSKATSLEQAMQGRIAGVQVTQNSGAPGGGISVAIRGINSLNGNDPLYVIDGIATSGGLNTINPSDIVSIDILKGASAAAIYGSRASNGVVMISTKQGEIGKPKLSYDGSLALQQLPKKIPVMNLKEYAQFYNDRATVQGWGLRDEFRDLDLLTDGSDWQGELFRTAPKHEHTVSVSGGSSVARYFLSGGFLNEDGIGLGSNFRRFSFRSNMDMEITKWLKIGVNVSASNTKRITTMEGSGLINTAINQRPDQPVRNPDGTYGVIEPDEFNTYYSNPVAEAQMKENYNTDSNVSYNFYAGLDLLPGLNLRTEFNGNLGYGNRYAFTPNYQYGTVVWTSQVRKESSKNEAQTFRTDLTYNNTLADKHHLTIQGVHEAISWNGESMFGRRLNYISNAVHSLNVGSTMPADANGDNMWKGAMESYLGRVAYNFDNRYLLTGTLRADGSSAFGPNNRWGLFPSFSLAWRISNESFLKDIEAINNLKLRLLEWGISGNQNAGAYAYGVSMRTTTSYWGTGFMPENFGNPDLQWEEKKAYNAGLDLTLFNNRVDFTVDAYYNKIDNLLMRATLPTYVVYMENWLSIQPPWVNAGALENKGIEFALNTVNILKRDLSWKTGLTFTLVRNKLTKLYSEESQIFGQLGSSVYTRSAVGDPIGRLFGYNVIGMFTCEDDFYRKDANGNFLLDEEGRRIEVARPAGDDGIPYPIAENQIWVGDYIFEDINGDGIINEKDRTFLGNTNPKFTYGINNTITWKNFDLNFFFYGVFGNKVYNVMRENRTGTNGYSGKLKEVAGYARVELIDPNGENVISNVYVTNPATATASRIYAVGGNRNDNERTSSRFVEDGSYFRLKNISLAYSVPRQWLQKNYGVDALQFYLNVQNLFTISKYKGFEPEVGSESGDVRLYGIDNGRYPSPRVYNFGLRFNF